MFSFLFVFLRLVASFSGLTIVDCSFGILQRLFVTFKIPCYPLYHNLSAASTTNTTLLSYKQLKVKRTEHRFYEQLFVIFQLYLHQGVQLYFITLKCTFSDTGYYY
jgi:hypothetical protein